MPGAKESGKLFNSYVPQFPFCINRMMILVPTSHGFCKVSISFIHPTSSEQIQTPRNASQCPCYYQHHTFSEDYCGIINILKDHSRSWMQEDSWKSYCGSRRIIEAGRHGEKEKLSCKWK